MVRMGHFELFYRIFLSFRDVSGQREPRKSFKETIPRAQKKGGRLPSSMMLRRVSRG